ncbi:glycosyltransferase [Brumicola blandensis]|uniref:Glycosyltransferase n=1 Tax=Brumicola blandensis TaxID=3075611 RepID=A0AAW8R1U8_9ALTE|nr:glycosyltransferase [Alteromonas sp. W409]MDT0582694.1 glycosyltransferase [Alteromonas sp. W409]
MINQISVCIPIKNDAKNLDSLLKSISVSDIDNLDYEILVCDGGSDDGPFEVVDRWSKTLNIKFIESLNGTASINLNKGINEARFKVFCRIDSHCKVSSNFFSLGLKQLNSDSANICAVGPIIDVTPRRVNKKTANAISHAFVSPFFMGPSRFKASKLFQSEARNVDTLYLGFFFTDDLRAIGGFNELIARKQDIDLLKRLRSYTKKKLLQSTELRIEYILKQDTVRTILKRAYTQGKLTTKYLNNVRLQHLLPITAFGLSLIAAILIPSYVLLFVCLYFFVSSVFLYFESRSVFIAFSYSFLFPACHSCFVLGNFKGLVDLAIEKLHKKKKKVSNEI